MLAIAALVAAYGSSEDEGWSDCTEEDPIIDAPDFRCGSAAFTRWK